MSIRTVSLYNTLSKKSSPFEPIEPGKVGLYCCGPTVYNYQHIGNLRTYIFEDLLARTLRYAGYKVKHVMNITDVGHLVSDADDGDDKMLLAAKREGKKSEEIADYYTEIFFEHCETLNILRPDVVCKATEHISQMIALIEKLEQKGFAYQAGGNVYFDVAKFNRYGELANLDTSQLQAGARVEADQNKHNPLDFALWFTKSKFDGQELQWDSPWGRGYPGWHIECSAMAIAYLGESFDIHCGGIDHIPVHHTNEIAQSECATDKQFAKVWMHGGFLVTAKQEKMSKSTGEFLTLDRLIERKIDPMSYRLFCMSSSYRQELSWSWDALAGAEKALNNIKSSVIALKSQGATKLADNTQLSAEARELLTKFETAIFDDLSFPRAIAELHAANNNKAIPPNDKLTLLLTFDLVLGLGMNQWQDVQEDIPAEVTAHAEARLEARKNKNFAEADRLRDEILALGYQVKDNASGYEIIKG